MTRESSNAYPLHPSRLEPFLVSRNHSPSRRDTQDKKKTSRAKSPEGPLPEGASEEVAIMEEEEVVPEQLRYVLAVTNTGDGPMRFTAAVNQSVAVLDTRDEFCR